MQNVDRRRRPSTRSRTRTCCARRTCPPSRPAGSASTRPATNLPQVVGTSMASGHFLDAVSRALSRGRARRPGRERSSRSSSVGGHIQVYLGNTWFNVDRDPEAGAARLDARHDRVHLPAGRRAAVPGPAEPVRDLRARQRQRRHPGLEPARADRRPAERRRRQVSRPSDALEARAAAKGQFTTLLLGLGAVALLVGAIGIANIMVISVLERRGEIGLRRALGRHPAPHQRPVPGRVGAARGARRRRRPGARRRRHRGLRGGAERAVRGAAVRADRGARPPAS